MNYKFDLDEWLPRFPLKPQHGHYSGEIITGPGHICNNEHLRCEMQDEFEWGRAVPVDIFVMANGEPEHRWATKIGGLPYRSADEDWPTTADGKPLTFVGQFNFSDSKDIVGELPSDLLLIFSDNSDGPFDPIHFEWQPLGLTELIHRPQLPRLLYDLPPCYGHVFRTANFPAVKRRVPSDIEQAPMCRGLEVWSSYFVPNYQATQIGGAPYFIQKDDDCLPGRIVCTISSPMPDQHSAYPWLNHPEPLQPEGKWSFDHKYLMIGDAGCIYISIGDDGQLHYGESCD